MEETLSTNTYKDTKYHKWNVTKYFNGLLRREYQIQKRDINCNKLNEDYNRHKVLIIIMNTY